MIEAIVESLIAVMGGHLSDPYRKKTKKSDG